MAIYKNIKKITDLESLVKLVGDAQVLLASNRKNYKTSIDTLNQDKIVEVTQDLNHSDGAVSSINLRFKDGSIKRINVYHGETGDKGDKGTKGIRGDKGDAGIVDPNRSENFVMIVNDTESDDSKKVLSALQGILLNKNIKDLSEIFMTDEKYQLLFNNMVFIDAEFVTESDNENIQIFNGDNVEHKLYVKYWTYEDEGSTEYFIYNDVSNVYESIYLDLWADIYLGNTSGYFEASTLQLLDNTPLYVFNNKTKEYDTIKVENGNKEFEYYLEDADCIVNVNYDNSSKLYDYSLKALELQLNVYQQVSNGVFERILDKDIIDLSGLTMYYYLDSNNEYQLIENITAWLEKKSTRWFKKSSDNWVEVSSLDNIDIDNFEEYITVEYNKSTNTNTFNHYIHVKTIRDEYYEVKTGVLNNYSISYYIYDDSRDYFTRKLVEKEDGSWDYEYFKINIPFWVDAEFITFDEDQTIQLLNTDKFSDETEIIDPIYINSIEFEESPIVMAKNSANNININYSPANINVTDVILEYDENIITLFEDGRIAALTTPDITTNTSVTVYSEHDQNVKDTLHIKVVTPVEKINVADTQINLYPGDKYKIEYTTYPEEVSDNSISWSSSDKDMIAISPDGIIIPKVQNDGSYKTGTCNLVLTANDGFGATTTVPVLVALPVSSVNIISKNYGFIGVRDQILTEILPTNATEQTLKYYSSNPDVIEINENTGEYLPKTVGSATLSAVTTDGTNLTDSIDVNITVGVNEIKITGIDDTLDVGLTNEFTITVLPEEANNKQISFIISDTTLVDYVEPTLVEGTTNIYRGSITAKKGGITNIAAIALDGSEKGFGKDLTVTIPVDNIELSVDSLSIFINDIVTIQAFIGPDEATNKEVTWISSNSAVASIDNYGRVRGLSHGSTTISALSKDNNFVVASCILHVNVAAEDLIINDGKENISVLVNNSLFVNALISPDNTSNQIISWSSEDTSIASIDNNGILYGNNIGTTIITATTTDGTNISRSISVNVIDELPTE